jgi:hypothetical protein
MSDSLIVVLALAGAYGLGFLLRLKAAVLAAIVLGIGAAAITGTGASSTQLEGAVALGALAGFAFGWAGSLTRRLLRRR